MTAYDHRTAQATLTLLGEGGAPLPGRRVRVEQLRHAFLFGNIGFDFLPLANGDIGPNPRDAGIETFGGAPLEGLERLAGQWLELFNTATLPFYWGRFESRRGDPDTVRLRRTAEWFAERGVALKGHPLVWHTVTAPWLLDLGVDEIEAAQGARIDREVGGFAGLIDTWDVVNEAVIMPVFDKYDNGITRLAKARGRVPLIRWAFERARAANPAATLLLNDFNLSSAYEELIEEVLDAGVRIDALGLQTHMHQGYRGDDVIRETVDRFARFGLPIHMTENTILSGHPVPREVTDLNDYRIDDWPSTAEGEARQADELGRHYRNLVSHPAVQAITYWGITDAGSWLGAPSGLIRADGTPKAAYDALRDLIKGQWWLAPTTRTTDADGRIQVDGFLGDYRIEADGRSAGFTLTTPGAQSVEVRLGTVA